MKNVRIQIACGVLCGILLLTGWSVAAVRRCCSDLMRHADAVLAAPDDAVLQQLSALEKDWEKNRLLLRFFIPNQQLIEINAEIRQLRAHYTEQSDEMQAGLYAVRADLEWLRRQELTIF